MAGLRWHDFEAAAPAVAAVGRRLLYHPERGEVGILATVNSQGQPRIAPVCPIYTDAGVYLSIAAGTPKAKDLARSGAYALHAQVGADDLEFQIRGSARKVDEPAERQTVIAAIPFPSYSVEDPIFELLIEQALSVCWPEAEEGSQRAIWRASGI